MAYQNRRMRRKLDTGYEEIAHPETNALVVLRVKDNGAGDMIPDTSRTVESSLTALESRVDTLEATSGNQGTSLGNKMDKLTPSTALSNKFLIVNTSGQAIESDYTHSSFAAATHTHDTGDITGLSEAITSETSKYIPLAGSTSVSGAIKSSSTMEASAFTVTLPAASTASSDKIVVFDATGKLTYRTKAQILDDIAAAPLSSPTFTGSPEAPTAAAGTNTTQLATTAFVQTAVNALMDAKDALRFVGTLSGTSTFPAANAGHVYRITSDGTINGLTVHTGDTATCCVDGTAAGTPANWFITHTNHDGQVMGPTDAVNNHVAIFDGATGKLIKDSGFTIASSVPADAVFTDTVYTHPNAAANVGSFGPTANASPAFGGTFKVPYVTVDAAGHVTGASTKTITLPALGNTVDISWSNTQPTGQKNNDIWMEPIT